MPDVWIARGTADDLDVAVEIDDDASLLYHRAGMSFALVEDHPFLLAEAARWRACAEDGGLWLARVDGDDAPVGFLAIGRKDGARYVDQLSVRCRAQRRGVGVGLLRLAQGIAGAEGLPLLLTTYNHLPWNAPFYAARGFRVLEAHEPGPGLRATLEAERAVLPRPEQRVGMRWDPSPADRWRGPGDGQPPALS